jgi:hypothetical protein
VSDLLAVLRHWRGNWNAIRYMFAHHDLRTFAQLMDDHLRAAFRAWVARRDYRVLDTAALRARKKSRRVFVFGSGYSLNEMNDDEYARIGREDSLGFTGSIYLKRLDLTYLLLRAWTETSAGSLAWRKDADEVIGAIVANDRLKDTIFVLQEGLTAIFPNRLVGERVWPADRSLSFFRSDKVSKYPHRDYRDGVVHGTSTLCSAISMAVGLGYDEIVLVGVDLYDSRYFWLPPDKTLGWSASEGKLVAADRTVRGAEVTGVHNTVNNGVVTLLADWRRHLLSAYGVEMKVYNPRSLAAGALPVFDWESAA